MLCILSHSSHLSVVQSCWCLSLSSFLLPTYKNHQEHFPLFWQNIFVLLVPLLLSKECTVGIWLCDQHGWTGMKLSQILSEEILMVLLNGLKSNFYVGLDQACLRVGYPWILLYLANTPNWTFTYRVCIYIIVQCTT